MLADAQIDDVQPAGLADQVVTPGGAWRCIT
jgi:hypothetical protein